MLAEPALLKYAPTVNLPVVPPLQCESRLGKLKGAGDEIRTRDIQLGRLTLYQLSYSRWILWLLPDFLKRKNFSKKKVLKQQ